MKPIYVKISIADLLFNVPIQVWNSFSTIYEKYTDEHEKICITMLDEYLAFGCGNSCEYICFKQYKQMASVVYQFRFWKSLTISISSFICLAHNTESTCVTSHSQMLLLNQLNEIPTENCILCTCSVFSIHSHSVCVCVCVFVRVNEYDAIQKI